MINEIIIPESRSLRQMINKFALITKNVSMHCVLSQLNTTTRQRKVWVRGDNERCGSGGGHR